MIYGIVNFIKNELETDLPVRRPPLLENLELFVYISNTHSPCGYNWLGQAIAK